MLNGKNLFLTLLLILAVTFFKSCKKDSKESTPVIPPIASMSIDFSFLSTEKNGSINLTNWQFSTVSLALWNNLLNKQCAIPITSFEKAVEQKAAYIEDNTWEWSYKFLADSIWIGSKLLGKLVNDSVDWKLYISTTNQGITSKEFLWIEGRSAKNQSGGWWLINEKPSSPDPLLKMLWSHNGGLTANKCIYIKPDDTDSGSSLEYGPKNDLQYNTYYIIELHNNNSIFIELNQTNKEGRIKSNLIFSDEIWHCWNSSFENIDCSN